MVFVGKCSSRLIKCHEGTPGNGKGLGTPEHLVMEEDWELKMYNSPDK